METLPYRYRLSLAFWLAWSVCGAAFGQTWTPSGAPSNSWVGVACSADGSEVVAATRSSSSPANGQIYISGDGGTNWTLSSAPNLPWFSLSISADGTRLAAEASGFEIYTSTNAGETWILSRTSLSTAGDGGWQSLAASADGSTLATANYTSAIFLSTNVGSAWRSQTTPLFDVIRLASSADGVSLVAANNNGELVASTNAGVSWSPLKSVGAGVTSLAGSVDLRRLVLVESRVGLPRSQIVTSENMGQTWITNRLPATNWTAVATSADGTKFVAAASGGLIYTSTDSGATWLSNSAPALEWQAVASTADGNVLFAAASNGSIWARRTVPAPELAITSVSDGLKVSWLVPSVVFKPQQTSRLMPGGSWTDVTNTITLNLSNLNNELKLPRPAMNTFYRLQRP